MQKQPFALQVLKNFRSVWQSLNLKLQPQHNQPKAYLMLTLCIVGIEKV